MKTFPLEILAVDKVFYSGPCEMLVVPATDGELGIMAGRQPVVAAIHAGELRVTKPGGEKILAAVGAGLIEVTENDVTVLVDFAEYADEIDEVRAKEAKERAEEAIRSQTDAHRVAHAEAALSRAMARLRTKHHAQNRN
jgi:F-type H+-transporting ATPase subunit epsilon